MYNSLIWEDSNAETITAFRDDPETYIIIATIKFGMGMDVRNVWGVINLGLPSSAAALVQQICRAGRDPNREAYGFTYVEASKVKAAKVMMKDQPQGGGKLRKQNMNKEILVETADSDNGNSGLQELINRHATGSCLVAGINQIFDNPGIHSHESCLFAQRPHPCSSCMAALPAYVLHTQSNAPIAPMPSLLSVLPPSTDSLVRLQTALVPLAGMTPEQYPKLTKNLSDRAALSLDAFSLEHWMQLTSSHLSWSPYASFIPSGLHDTLLARFTSIHDYDSFLAIMGNWEHIPTCGPALFQTIADLNSEFDSLRKVKKAAAVSKASETRRAKAVIGDPTTSSGLSNIDLNDTAMVNAASEPSMVHKRPRSPIDWDKPRVRRVILRRMHTCFHLCLAYSY